MYVCTLIVQINMFKPSTGGRDQETLKQRGSGENNSGNPGFYSLIFLVPKKNGKLRLIIDLSKLNFF